MDHRVTGALRALTVAMESSLKLGPRGSEEAPEMSVRHGESFDVIPWQEGAGLCGGPGHPPVLSQEDQRFLETDELPEQRQPPLDRITGPPPDVPPPPSDLPRGRASRRQGRPASGHGPLGQSTPGDGARRGSKVRPPRARLGDFSGSPSLRHPEPEGPRICQTTDPASPLPSQAWSLISLLRRKLGVSVCFRKPDL